MIYFNPKSISSIREAAKKVVYGEELRKNLKTKGFKRVKKFSWHKTTKRQNLYTKVFYNNNILYQKQYKCLKEISDTIFTFHVYINVREAIRKSHKNGHNVILLSPSHIRFPIEEDIDVKGYLEFI